MTALVMTGPSYVANIWDSTLGVLEGNVRAVRPEDWSIVEALRQDACVASVAEEWRFRRFSNGRNLNQLLEDTNPVPRCDTGIEARQRPRRLLLAYQSRIKPRLQRRWGAFPNLLWFSKQATEFPI